MQTAVLDTPIGTLAFDIEGDALVHTREVEGPAVPAGGEDHPIAKAIASYFGGDMAALDGIPVHYDGTPFQQAVWEALRTIPVGETISYAELAVKVGRPAAVRAVGQANGRNPVWVVVPCHRVVAANGGLGGYSAGLDRKRWLLNHEGARPDLGV
jgi:methylated-DNA-[protein]-cysteine S-methyltransferase